MKSDKEKETLETWDKIANIYQDKFMEMNLYNTTYNYFSVFISKENAQVLDIGCGPGNITKYLLSKNTNYKIVGIDYAPNMIELAKKNNPRAEFQVLDTRNIIDLNQKFDGIICGFCIPYLTSSETRQLILDSYNLLNQNGVLYISFVEGNPEDSTFKTGSNGRRVYFNYYNLEDLKSDLSKNNFQLLETFKVDYTESEVHTIVVAQKL